MVPFLVWTTAVVEIRTGTIGIISMPAGTEIKVRMPGTRLPQTTKAVPTLLNQRRPSLVQQVWYSLGVLGSSGAWHPHLDLRAGRY